MVKLLPQHAIEKPFPGQFRGPWRGDGYLWKFIDFTEPGILETLNAQSEVTLSKAGGTIVTSASEPILSPLAATSETNRPEIPGAQVMEFNFVPGNGSGVSQGRMTVDLSGLEIPTGATVTRVDFWYSALTSPSSTSVNFKPIVDEIEAAPPIVQNSDGYSWQYVSAIDGVSRNSAIGLELNSTSSTTLRTLRYATTGISIYVVDDEPYSLGDTVTYDGVLWQSVQDDNNDTPGTSLRWTRVPLVGTLREEELPQGTGRSDVSDLVNAASSAFTVRSCFIRGEDPQGVWIDKIQIYSAGGGNVRAEVCNMYGDILAFGEYVDNPSGSPSWTTVSLDTPVLLRYHRILALTFRPTSSCPIYRRTGANYVGPLFGVMATKGGGVTPVESGNIYTTETMGIGIIEYGS